MTLRPSHPRAKSRWVLALSGVGLLVALAVGSVLAVHDATGPMQLEGDIIDADPNTDPQDWGVIFGTDGLEIPANLPVGTLDTTNVIKDFDIGASGPDETYHEPSNKDDQAIDPDGDAVWGCVSVPNATDKTDIVNAYGMAVQGDAEVGDGDTADDQLFYFGVERFDNSGDAFIGLWLFQDDVSCDSAGTGKFVGSKRTGDILVLANFTGGGSDATVQLFRYTAGAGSAAGTFDLLGAGGACGESLTGDQTAPENDLCATINDTNSFVTPWAMEDKTKPGPPTPDATNEVDPDQFVEGGVNLTDIFAATQGTPPPCFGSFLAETRSSSSLDATLKDYALGDLQFCDARIKITPDDTNRIGTPHTFVVDVEQQLGAGFVAAPTGHVDFTLTDANGAVSVVDTTLSTCDNAGDNLDNVTGQCTIVFNSNSTGTVTGTATVSVNVGGTSLTRDANPATTTIPSGYTPDSPPAVKTYVDATIDITGDDTNRVGQEHTFTVTVKSDDGGSGGLAAVGAGQDVDVTLATAGGAAYVLNTGSTTCDVVGSGQPHDGGGTNASGQCVVVFTSNDTGTVTGTASALMSYPNSLSFTVTTANDAETSGNESVLKTFVDATIDITGDDTNRIGQAHTFTVTVKSDDGGAGGLVAVGAGQDVDVTLTVANGAVVVLDTTLTTCDVPASTHDGAGTNASGQCIVVFTSNNTGTVTGTASALMEYPNSLSFTVTTANDAETSGNESVLKTFVDATIDITGDDTNGIEEAHTFTVTVKKDSGGPGGLVAVGAGQDVDVTLTNAGGAAYILDTSATTCDVVGAAGTHDGAGTNASGQCVVVFTSNSAGTVTGTASALVTFPDSLSFTVTTANDAETSGNESVLKTFVDGSLSWLKHDGDGELLGGATFEVCRISRLDSSDGSYVAEDSDPNTIGDQPVCFTVLDDATIDNDKSPGELEVIDLVLGQYTVEETIPPAGYHIQDPPGAGPFSFPDMTIEPLNVDVTLDTIFVNIKAYRIIVLTCDDITDTLVVSTITLDGAFGGSADTWDTVPTVLDNLGVTEGDLCGIETGASFGDLPDNTYDLHAIVPKAS